MRELTWGVNKARVWLNELPCRNYDAAYVAEHRLLACGMRDGNRQRMAVEMLVPIGPMVMYGALGAIFVPKLTKEILLQVFVSAKQEQLFSDTLALESERVHVGFPEEYVQGLLEGVAQFEGTSQLGTGTLSFCWAMYGEMGSSIKFFQRISRVIIRLLYSNKQAFSDEELLELLRQSL